MSVINFSVSLYHNLSSLLHMAGNAQTICDFEVINFEALKAIQVANTPINTESSVNFTTSSALKGEGLENIRAVVSNALKKDTLSIKEKIDIFEKTKNLFSFNHSSFNFNDLCVPICLVDVDGVENHVRLSLEQCCSSSYFRPLLSGEYNDGLLIAEVGELRVFLPENVSAEDIHNIENIESINDVNKLIGCILAANYLDITVQVDERLQDICGNLENQELFDLITQLSDGLLSDDHISIILSAYIRSCFCEVKKKFEAGSEYGDTVASLMADKISDVQIQNAIKDRVIKLDLSGLDISNQELYDIAKEIPNVAHLNISKTKITEIPECWLEKIINLNISETSFTSISRGLVNLEVFEVTYAKLLDDISGLDNLKKLREICVSYTNITSAPFGCDNLETFYAEKARMLDDISGLDNLKKLKEITASSTKILSAPTGCDNLEVFNAGCTKTLKDVSGLNNLKKLTKVSVENTSITLAPTGCDSLEIFKASDTQMLYDISGLNNLKKLREVYVTNTSITLAPIGCDDLEVFDAANARMLDDISGLNNLKKLKEINLSKTEITRAPTGCDNLQVFWASDVKTLTDISGLNNLKKIKSIFIPGAKILSNPTGCDSLEIFKLDANHKFYFYF